MVMGLSCSLIGPNSTPARSPGCHGEVRGQPLVRASDTEEGAAGNPVTKSAAPHSCSLAWVISLTSTFCVLRCLAQTNKWEANFLKAIDVVSGLA